MEKGNKKIIRGWVFYDWANSVYNLVISSAIFPIFYNLVTTKSYLTRLGRPDGVLNENENPTVLFLGLEVSNSVILSFVLSASFLLVSFLSPLLSGIADYTGSKKKFLRFFCYLGSLSCISLYWFDANHFEFAMISVFFASIGFWNSLVFYNAFLPEIAEPQDQDKISARGFIMGYFGSMILLIICLSFIMTAPNEYLAKTGVMRWCFVGVGLWWIGFSQITYRALPNNVYGRKPKRGLWRGFRELYIVYRKFKKTQRLKKYLYSFFFFNTGVQTVMLMATIFASKEINWPKGQENTGLIVAILLIQILGARGAFIMSRLSGKIGNIKTLMISISIWLCICVGAYFITTPVQFYILAATVGLVMGGVQAIARSTYSKFLPETKDHASYFSFYDVTEKLGIVLGTFFFGMIEALTGDLRFSVISIGVFFLVGFILLWFVPKEEKIIGRRIGISE